MSAGMGHSILFLSSASYCYPGIWLCEPAKNRSADALWGKTDHCSQLTGWLKYFNRSNLEFMDLKFNYSKIILISCFLGIIVLQLLTSKEFLAASSIAVLGSLVEKSMGSWAQWLGFTFGSILTYSTNLFILDLFPNLKVDSWGCCEDK